MDTRQEKREMRAGSNGFIAHFPDGRWAVVRGTLPSAPLHCYHPLSLGGSVPEAKLIKRAKADCEKAEREFELETAQMEADEMASAIAEAAIDAVDAEYRNERWAKLLDTWNYDEQVLMAPTAVAFAVRRAVHTALAPKALAQTRRELRERIKFYAVEDVKS